MNIIRWLMIGSLVGGTGFAGAATLMKMGSTTVDHPQGISLRDESAAVAYGAGRRIPYRSRTFRGGGPRSGK